MAYVSPDLVQYLFTRITDHPDPARDQVGLSALVQAAEALTQHADALINTLLAQIARYFDLPLAALCDDHDPHGTAHGAPPAPQAPPHG
jgi:hypothetical protein